MKCHCGLLYESDNAFKQHKKACKLGLGAVEFIIRDYVDNELTYKQIYDKYGITSLLAQRILRGVGRTKSQAGKLADAKGRKPKTLSEETKDKIRQKRLAFMKANPEQTAWRRSNMSYPEKVFTKKIEELELDKQFLIVRERSVFPYYIDFAFENEKVAVEIDGSQHELPERKANDKIKDAVLVQDGWRVYRVTASQVQQNIDVVMKDVLEFIGGSKSNGQCGLVTYKSMKIRAVEQLNKEREANGGLTNKELERARKQSLARPPYQDMIQDTTKLGFSATGRKYGVSDNSIRKWIKAYEKTL